MAAPCDRQRDLVCRFHVLYQRVFTSHRSPAIRQRTKPLINYDALINADRSKVTNRTVSIFDRLQLKRDKELNLLALACSN